MLTTTTPLVGNVHSSTTPLQYISFRFWSIFQAISIGKYAAITTISSVIVFLLIKTDKEADEINEEAEAEEKPHYQPRKKEHKKTPSKRSIQMDTQL